MNFQKLSTDILSGSAGALATLETIGETTAQNVPVESQTMLVNSIVAIVASFISTGLKNLFAKWFGKNKGSDTPPTRNNRRNR